MRAPAGTGRTLAAVFTLVPALVAGLGGCVIERTADPVFELETTPSPAKKGEIALEIDVVNRGGGAVVLVPVKIGGRGPYDFILDTGASTSAVDARLAKRLKLARTGETAPISGVTGTADLPLVRVPAWTVGRAKLKPAAVPVIELSGAAFGLLGADQLRRFGAVRIDFTHERLILHDR